MIVIVLLVTMDLIVDYVNIHDTWLVRIVFLILCIYIVTDCNSLINCTNGAQCFYYGSTYSETYLYSTTYGNYSYASSIQYPFSTLTCSCPIGYTGSYCQTYCNYKINFNYFSILFIQFYSTKKKC